jgi:hypothetical protein
MSLVPFEDKATSRQYASRARTPFVSGVTSVQLDPALVVTATHACSTVWRLEETAARLDPSAEEATGDQPTAGRPLEDQLTPKSGEVNTS